MINVKKNFRLFATG